MHPKTMGSLLVTLVIAMPLTMRADRDDRRHDDRDCRESEHHEHNVNTPVQLLGVIAVPGNPIMSTDIGWVDPGTERFYLADRSNFGVDIIEAEDNFYAGRVAGMAGPKPSGGGTSTTNGPGPNGVLVTPNRRLWAGDGNSTVQVADVDPDSPTYLMILKSVNTANATCDTNTPPGNPASTTGHWCGRADELGYDPKDHLILVANNAPLSPAKICPTPTNPAAHCAVAPYATLIDARTYGVLGQITFTGAGGLEQPLWDAALRRFWITVPGPAGGSPMIARIDPTKLPLTVDKSIVLDCQALTGTASASITGIALLRHGGRYDDARAVARRHRCRNQHVASERPGRAGAERCRVCREQPRVQCRDNSRSADGRGSEESVRAVRSGGPRLHRRVRSLG